MVPPSILPSLPVLAPIRPFAEAVRDAPLPLAPLSYTASRCSAVATTTDSLNGLSMTIGQNSIAVEPTVPVVEKLDLYILPPFAMPRPTQMVAFASSRTLSASRARVIFHLVVAEPTSSMRYRPFWAMLDWCMTRMRLPTAGVWPSIAPREPFAEAVRVAPTPETPLAYAQAGSGPTVPMSAESLYGPSRMIEYQFTAW